MSGAGSTPRGARTRRRIVEGTAAELRQHGADLTLDDVLTRTATSKSQLFHYFPGGKEELLLAVAQHEAGRVLADQQPELDNLSTWASWNAWRDRVVTRYTEQGPNCPLHTVLARAGRSTPGAQAVVTQLTAQWQAKLAAGVRALRAAGLVPRALDADRSAAALLAGIQGGVVLLVATGTSTHLEAALDEGIARLQTAGR
ncbi:TetR/AcrR family transcriptional regulator [Streptomyces sp. NPDC091272]|uniref:TetR/AcrR family transcriptional regulator n=1 Tax=Streptomyces sp. NPDC091272 TaxID=3365981 RepID=UPI00382D586C